MPIFRTITNMDVCILIRIKVIYLRLESGTRVLFANKDK